MILITGATGHLGSATIDFLLKNTPASQVAALVRNPEKAEELTLKGIDVRQGDFTDYESMVRAFEGVDSLGFVSSSAREGRVKQHTNVIDAAKAAGVRRIAYTSVLRPQPGAKFGPTADHVATEAYLKNVGLTYTLLRNTFYFDGFGYMVDVSRALESGQLVYPAGGGKITLASRTDMAEALAAVLTEPGHANQVYEISSERAYSFDDIARLLSDLSGKPVQHVDQALDLFEQGLKQANLLPEAAGMAMMLAETVRNDEMNCPDPSLERLIGHKPLSLADYLKQTYFSARQPVA